MHDVDPVLTDFKATMEKVDAQLAKFEELCQQQKNVRKTIFYRAKHALGHVERQKLHIQQLLRRFVVLFPWNHFHENFREIDLLLLYTDCYILSSIFRFVDALLQMVSSRNLHALEDPAASDWQFVLETVDTFNKVRKLIEISLKSQKRNIGNRVWFPFPAKKIPKKCI